MQPDRRQSLVGHGGELDDDDNKPVWPTLAVGVLSGVRDVETYNRGCPA